MPISYTTEFRRQAAVMAADLSYVTDSNNFSSNNTGVCTINSSSYGLTVGPFYYDENGSQDVFSSEIPSNATITGISVQIGAFFDNNGSPWPTSGVNGRFRIRRATSTISGLTGNWADTGTWVNYNGSDSLLYYSGPDSSDPADYNFTFGGTNNLLGIPSYASPSAYNFLSLQIEYLNLIAGVKFSLSSRAFSDSLGPSVGMKLHYTVPGKAKLYVGSTSKIRTRIFSKVNMSDDIV